MHVLTEQVVIKTLADMAKFYIFILKSLQVLFEQLQFRCVDLTVAISIKEGEDLHRACEELGRVRLAADGLRVKDDQTERCDCIAFLLTVQTHPWSLLTEAELMAEITLHIAAFSRPFEETEAETLRVASHDVNETTV